MGRKPLAKGSYLRSHIKEWKIVILMTKMEVCQKNAISLAKKGEECKTDERKLEYCGGKRLMSSIIPEFVEIGIIIALFKTITFK